MYTSGHAEILADALAKLSVGAKRRFHGLEKDLENALAYPDFPCGKIRVKGHEIKDRFETCSVLNLFVSMVFKKLSLGNQSHNGFYALWHSMTIDPDKSVENVARNVVEYVLICLKLAREKTSVFWLGFALHIVMDSYSPAHVLREGFLSRDVENLDIYLKMYDSELSESQSKDVSMMKSIVETVVDSTARGIEPSVIVRSYSKEYKDSVAFVIFDHMQRRSMKKLIGRVSFSSFPRKKSHNHEIMNFYYYPDQSTVFHKMYDLLSAVKDAKLYEPCLGDVADILELFARPTGLKEFLVAARTLLLTRTFRTRSQCRDVKTGFDIDVFVNPFRRSVVFNRTDSSSLYRAYDRMQNYEISITKFGNMEIVADVPVVKNERTRPEVAMKTCRFVNVSNKVAKDKTLGRVKDESTFELMIIQAGTFGYPEFISFDSRNVVYKVGSAP